MTRRNHLICFDAFGTLFKPRRPIPQQYGEVGRSLGMHGFADEDIDRAFRSAFKSEAKKNPNYGKATRLGAEKWWANVISKTFSDIVGSDQALPEDLVPRLIHRFSSNEGYTPMIDALPLIRKIRESCRLSGKQVVVGVITNSDDRVPDILTSFGWEVSPLRCGTKPSQATLALKHDIDFTIMSYDAGYEKPDRRIFDAATKTFETIVQATTSAEDALQPLSDWDKVYVGDEYDKDVVGALSAGWNAVIVEAGPVKELPDVMWPGEHDATSLSQIFERTRAVGFQSLSELAKRFPA